MRLYGAESFGPVVTVVPVDGVDEAVRVVANDTEYGLSGAYCGRYVPRAFDVARRLETGICHVSGAIVHDEPQMPFGGSRGPASAASDVGPRSRSSRSCAGSRSAGRSAAPISNLGPDFWDKRRRCCRRSTRLLDSACGKELSRLLYRPGRAARAARREP
jgi:hypothetical protein